MGRWRLFAMQKELCRGACKRAPSVLRLACEPYLRLQSFVIWTRINVDGFSPEARLLPTAYACKQTTPYGKRTNHICVATQHKVVEPVPSQQKKKNRPSIDGLLSLAGMDGFEPSKCQSQSLVPYRLATSQYCVSIVSHFILVVKHFIKIFLFYEILWKSSIFCCFFETFSLVFLNFLF